MNIGTKYTKEWREKNKERFQKYCKDYRQKNKEKLGEYHKLWYLKNRERILANKEHHNKLRSLNRHKVKTEILNLLGNKCKICGYSGLALQIDHVNGNGKRDKLYRGTDNYYRHILKEIKNGSKEYQLLCANHNWEKALSKGEIHNNRCGF